MLSIIRKFVSYTSSSKGAKITIVAWIIADLALSMLAPSARDHESSSMEGSIQGNKPSEIANDILDEKFSTADGLTALIVFHKDAGLEDIDIKKITQFSMWLDSNDKPENIASTLPFHQFPAEVQSQMFSEDDSTL